MNGSQTSLHLEQGDTGKQGKRLLSPPPTGFFFAWLQWPHLASLVGCPQDVFCLVLMAETRLFQGRGAPAASRN